MLKRAVTFEDSDLILVWRNSVDARRSSQKPEEISRDEHESWLRNRVLRVNSEPFWVMSLGKKIVGYVRLDYFNSDQNVFTISIFVVLEYRNVGLGKQMLVTALSSTASNYPDSFFRAVVKNDNKRSAHLFQHLGFKYQAKIDSEFTEYRLSAREIIKKCD